MTNTTIVNAGALPGTSDQAPTGFTKTTLQTGTTAVLVNVKVVCSPEAHSQGNGVKIYYAVSPFSLTADSTLITSLRPIVGLLFIPYGQEGGATKIDSTGVIANNGGFLYTWWEASRTLSPNSTNTPGTITITSTELP